jgi:hypothetical protein
MFAKAPSGIAVIPLSLKSIAYCVAREQVPDRVTGDPAQHEQ